MISLFVLALFHARAFAFPEMLRHGYTQCTACHVSPAGGGILTEYGRELSGEILSTWNRANEAQFLHSSVGKKLAAEGLLFGGDVRAIQTRYQDSEQRDGKLFLMQANLQSAYETQHFTGVVSVGEIRHPLGPGTKGDLDATAYYGYVKFNDEFGLRAGRFIPAYGLNLPDHTVAVKDYFSPIAQYDTVEFNYLNQTWTVLVSFAKALTGESVRSANVSYAIAGHYRLGVSYWHEEGESMHSLYGANAILGFTAKLYGLSEIDREEQNGTSGQYALSQLGYEVFQGFTPYVQAQLKQNLIGDANTREFDVGAGAHFYPRPHFEFSAELDYQTTTAGDAQTAYMVAHYYF